MAPRFKEAFRRARTGDPRAFRTLADHLGPELVRFLTTFLGGDVHAAHDVTQDVLVQAWDNIQAIKNVGHLRRWCYRVARCKAVSWLRRRRPPGRTVEPLHAEEVAEATRRGGRGHAPRPPEPHGDEDDLTIALRRALLRLPANYAGPVHLHYVQGFSTREAAVLLGLKRQTFKMRLHRARAFLRREIHRDQFQRGRAQEPVRKERP